MWGKPIILGEIMIPQNWRENILGLAKKACDAHNISLATLGNKIFNDADFFPSIKEGRNCGMNTYFKAIAWFDKNIPHNGAHINTGNRVVKGKVKNN